MKIKLLSVTQSQFRQTINEKFAQVVRQAGDTTLLYGADKHLVAAMKPASIDSNGRCQPVSYYICA